MSVPNKIPIARYVGNGELKEFSIPFPYLSTEDLRVKSSVRGNLAATAYAVDGSTITFTEAPQDGEIIAILRNTAVERIADYDDTGAVSAASLNDNFDRPLLTIQEIEEVLSRCVQMDPTSGESPEGYLDKVITVTENAKDVSLNAAVSAANSAQAAATSERNVALIWAEITGDTSLADNALLTLKEAAEATGAITAAKEIAVGEIRSTGAVAIAATEKAADEAREAADIAANAASSISQTVADQIAIQVSQASGANGVLGVAVEAGKNVVESARQEAYEKAQEALNKITAGNKEFSDQSNAALNQIQGKVDSVAIDVQAAIERAQIIANNYLKNAQATVSGSIADLELMKQQAGSDTELIALINKRIAELQELQGYLTDAESAKTAAENFSQAASSSAGNASASASSAGSSASNAAGKAAEALLSAQAAATSASNAAASAVAASTTATEVSNQLLTVHNASTEAHPALMRGQITDPISIPENADLNDYKDCGYYYCRYSDVASKMLNIPHPTAFGLEVFCRSIDNNPIIYQRFTGLVNRMVYIRRYYGYEDEWFEWERIAFEGDLKNYLPIGGGTVNSNFTLNRDGVTGRVNIVGGADYTYGGWFSAFGKDYDPSDSRGRAGAFELGTCRSDGHYQLRLIGYPDGRLDWGGKLLLESGVYGRYDSARLVFSGGTSYQKGGHLVLNGQNSSINPGGFEFTARTESNGGYSLYGKTDGTLTWGGKKVLTEETGAVVIETWQDGTSWYRKWSDGWIEQGGVGPTFGVASSCTVTLNVPFTTTSYTFQGTLSASGGISHNGLNIEAKTTSTIRLYSDNRTGGVSVEWYACGY